MAWCLPSDHSSWDPTLDRLTAAYDYELPLERIAQSPVNPRDQARLLVLDPQHHDHSHFWALPRWLRSGDLLVLNDTKVIPARVYGQKPTGAQIEILLLEPHPTAADQWLALVKPGRRIRPGDRLQFGSDLEATVVAADPASGGRWLQFDGSSDQSFEQILETVGEIPFPPYITERVAGPEDYQTIWASQPGSVAAPTAGLHFTDSLLQNLAKQGIKTATITLNIGLGTFRPVEAERVEDHQLHQEWLQVPAATVDQIHCTQAAGGRVIAVGTTVVRALETAAQQGSIQPWQGKSNLYIYPGYCWQIVDGLITNFHLPRSSLLMLVSAMIGRQRLLDLYAEAIQLQYRFYSFGDGMLILPELPRDSL